LDRTDKLLLLALDVNCRITFQALADKLGMTATAVKKRFEKLLDSGVIEEFAVILCPAMTGAEYLLAVIETDGLEDENSFMDVIGSNRMTMQVGQIASGRGRTYLVLAEYQDASGMQELGRLFRTSANVNNVELHTLLRAQGQRYEFKTLHLRVLKHLLKDARMQVSEISSLENLTARRVSRALRELRESNALEFGTRWNLSAGESTEFYIRVKYDQRSAGHKEIDDWLNEIYPVKYWYSFVSALEPVIFAKFVIDHFKDAAEITERVKKAPFVEKADALVSYPVRKYSRLGTIVLQEMLAEAGLWP
jgi:DNA-binding Lrp family transcriptional regulator